MPTCLRPWGPNPDCASCSFCSWLIQKGSLWATSEANWRSPIQRCRTILKSSSTRASSKSDVTARSCGTRPTRPRCRNYLVFFMRSAAPETTSWNPRRLFVASRRGTIMGTDIKDAVKEKYGEAALRVLNGGRSCCSTTSCGDNPDPITSRLYDDDQATQIPEEALKASLGCGNPTALATLNPGETVLDLGSGGGIDVLLSARRVGPTGKAYGLDMTDEMLALARDNQKKSGIENVEFLKGEMENIPLPDNSVDVIISNCVINLSADKDRVLRDAFRVLKPGGRFAVSDVVTRGAIPKEIRGRILLWVGCIAGALEENEYESKLAAAGFENVSLEPTRVYVAEDARAFLTGQGIDVDAIAPQVDGKFISAFVRAVKPKS